MQKRTVVTAAAVGALCLGVVAAPVVAFAVVSNESSSQVIPGGVPENPLKARWMGIYNGAGIHGTSASGSIGTAASHGCIRMLIPDVIELYDQVPVGAPVYIA